MGFRRPWFRRVGARRPVIPTVMRRARQPASQEVDPAFYESMGWIQPSPIRLFGTFLFRVRQHTIGGCDVINNRVNNTVYSSKELLSVVYFICYNYHLIVSAPGVHASHWGGETVVVQFNVDYKLLF